MTPLQQIEKIRDEVLDILETRAQNALANRREEGATYLKEAREKVEQIFAKFGNNIQEE